MTESKKYRVTQKGLYSNVDVSDFESLVTHHPFDNRNAVLVEGIPTNAEASSRGYGVIGGEIQEIATRKKDGTTIDEHQVLVKKDFILEHPDFPFGHKDARTVDVPSPVSGYIGRVSTSQGLVDVYDRKGGDLIARVRHMGPIAVTEGMTIEYGGALGTQNKVLTPKKHVHMEVDTRYYQQYENYIADLVNGRLAPSTGHTAQRISPLPIFDDGTLRIGETNSRIQLFQEELISRGYSGAHGKPLRADGVYRLEMQPAVLAFQQDHGLTQTGDIDRSTLHIALPLYRDQTIDRMDHVERSRAPFTPAPSSDAPVRGFQPGPDDYLRHPTRHEPEFQRSESSAAITSEPPARSDPRNHGHPDHALYDALRQRLPPQTSDDTVAHVMLQAKIGGVRNADELDKVIVQDGRAFVMGTTPGFRTAVDLSQIPSSIQEITQRSEALDQQHAMQRDQWFTQDQAQSRGMHHSL